MRITHATTEQVDVPMTSTSLVPVFTKTFVDLANFQGPTTNRVLDHLRSMTSILMGRFMMSLQRFEKRTNDGFNSMASLHFTSGLSQEEPVIPRDDSRLVVEAV